MMLETMSDEQLAVRIRIVERAILREQDWKNLPALNRTFQGIFDEQVRRDLAAEDAAISPADANHHLQTIHTDYK